MNKKYTIDQLRQVKGIGEKTIERIIEQFAEPSEDTKAQKDTKQELRLDHIYLGDVLEVLSTIPDESVDLILTSPPYNIRDFHANHLKYENYEGNNVPEHIYQKWMLQVLEELYRVLKDDGSMMFNHKVRIAQGKAIHPIEFLQHSPFVLKQEIVWWQAKGANTDKIRFFPFSERVYWMTKSPKTKMHNIDNAQDVFRIVPSHTRKETGHPAVMPYEVAEILMKPFPNVKVVLDPFAGTGTTLRVAKDMNKRYIGIELDQDYYNIAVERVEKAKG